MNETVNGGAAPPRCVGGLCVAIVSNRDGMHGMAAKLADEMNSNRAHTGILLVGSDFVRSPFGPLPPEWVRRGIGVVVARSDDLVAEAETLFGEYEIARAAAIDSVRRIGETARQRNQPPAASEPVDTTWVTETVRNRQHVETTVASRRPAPVRPTFKQWSGTEAPSDALQHATAGGSLGAGGAVSGAYGGGTQGGSMQGGGALGAGASQRAEGEDGEHSSGATGGETRGPTGRQGNM